MPSISHQSQLAVGGLVLIASWLTTLYLVRQNKALRAKLQSQDEPCGYQQRTSVASTSSETDESSDRTFVMEEIGVIQSPFPQRAGCPRQGTLSPHVKSMLVLHPHISKQVLDGITDYSHVWIIFSFHLNPRGKARQKQTSGTCKTSKFTSTKIKPPRANGRKVGVLATRAPHRPNPVGLSLALLQDVIVQQYNGRKQTCMVLRGLDLVDGTPVYDVKPFVPWDRIVAPDATHLSQQSADKDDLHDRMKVLRVPPWVSANDALAQVTWTQSAREQLHEVRNFLKPLYDATDHSVDEACTAIKEIIAQDPRAVRDGRGLSSVDTGNFEFTFGELRVKFVVNAEAKMATVSEVVVDHGDITASNGSYPHNLALRRLAEKEARENGMKIDWANPVREGVTNGLFDLRRGGVWKPAHLAGAATA